MVCNFVAAASGPRAERIAGLAVLLLQERGDGFLDRLGRVELVDNAGGIQIAGPLIQRRVQIPGEKQDWYLLLGPDDRGCLDAVQWTIKGWSPSVWRQVGSP